MKPSTSTTSLTELTSVTPENECFVCLEEMHPSGEPLVLGCEFVNCQCRFFVHRSCWTKWNTGDLKCPICRKSKKTIIERIEPPEMINIYLGSLCLVGGVSAIIALIVIFVHK